MKNQIILSVLTLGFIAGGVATLAAKKLKAADSFFAGKAITDSPTPRSVTAMNATIAVSKPQEKTTEIGHETLAENSPSLQELHYEYLNYKVSELEHELKESKRALKELGLVEKSNQRPLSAHETKTLIQEIRKQGVLSQLITKNKLNALKRKYL